MPSLGTLTVSTFRASPDSMEYSLPGDSLATRHSAVLRRQLGDVKKDQPNRLNLRIDKTVTVGDTTKVLTFHVTGVIPQGVPTATVLSEYSDTFLVAAGSDQAKALFTAGDVNLGD